MLERSVTEQGSSVALVPAEYERLLHAAGEKRWTPVWKQRLIVGMLVLSDVLLALLIWGVAGVAQDLWGQGDLSKIAVATIAPSIVVWVGLRALLGLYPGYGLDPVERLRQHTYSVFATLAVLAVSAMSLQVGDLLSRLLLALAFLGLLLITPFVQYFVKLGMKRAGLWGKPVIVLSYKDNGPEFLKLLEQEWSLGYVSIALLDYHLTPAGEDYQETPYLKTLTAAVNLGREQGVDTVIFATPHTRREQLASMVSVASKSFRHVLVVPNLNGVTNSAVAARNLAGTFAVEIKHNLLDPWAQRLKRVLDLVGVVVGGLLISPLLLAIFILIKLDSRGPALFVQNRPGVQGQMFKVLKFRTMHPDAEQRLKQLFFENPVLAREFEEHGKLKDDPRVTRVGRWLRKLSLDELPQLWNVLKGEMSLVGPRPYLVSQAAQMDGNEAVISRIAPGMSGLWQVSGRSEATFEERLDLDVYYVRNWSVWLDLIILARTVRIVLLGQGAY